MAVITEPKNYSKYIVHCVFGNRLYPHQYSQQHVWMTIVIIHHLLMSNSI